MVPWRSTNVLQSPPLHRHILQEAACSTYQSLLLCFQVQFELAEVSASWDSPEPAMPAGKPSRAPVEEPSRADQNGGHELALKSPPEKIVGAAGAAQDGEVAGAKTASGRKRKDSKEGGGVEPVLRSSPRRVVGAAGAARLSRSLAEKNKEEAASPSTNGGIGTGVRSSPRKVGEAVGAAREERAKEAHHGGNGRTTHGGGAEATLRSSPRRVVGAAGAVRQERAKETQRGANDVSKECGGVEMAVRSSPRRVSGAAAAARGGGVVGEKRKASGGRLSEDAERMQMMHRGQSAAEKRRCVSISEPLCDRSANAMG